MRIKKHTARTFYQHKSFFLQIFIKEVANNENDESQMDEITNLNPPKQRTLEQTGESQHGLLLDSNHREIDTAPSAPEVKPARNGKTYDATKTAKVFETQVSPSGKMQTSVKSISKRKISQQKEKKATQMLAIVLGKSNMRSKCRRSALITFYIWSFFLRNEKCLDKLTKSKFKLLCLLLGSKSLAVNDYLKFRRHCHHQMLGFFPVDVPACSRVYLFFFSLAFSK